MLVVCISLSVGSVHNFCWCINIVCCVGHVDVVLVCNSRLCVYSVGVAHLMDYILVLRGKSL